ncbi:DUF4157 domain-containing protein [Streptomyces sp. NPDC048290]|uniref:eCIS core domain-containing protein n=1 Tax=Streptomyces sp. NPDC048290 TaxID=3155811 RepID=UPI003444AC2B
MDGTERARLEAAFGVDLSEVHVHFGPTADHLARSFHADAFTVGADIFFSRGSWRPSTPAGMRLLAHEIAHSAQPHDGGGADRDHVQAAGHPAEHRAELAATSVAGGRRPAGPWTAPRRITPGSPVVVQCHGSAEHKELGECNSVDLDIVARAQAGHKGEGDSGDYLRKLRAYQLLWQTHPEDVTEDSIREHAPFSALRMVRLQKSGLLVTWGELNTLPDYLPQPDILAEQPKEVLLPILQSVRQELHNQIGNNYLLNDGDQQNFDGNIVNWRWPEFIHLILDTTRVNSLTTQYQVGKAQNVVGTYYALLARNACHFAPFSWHRWYAYYMKARSYAEKSYGQGEDSSDWYHAQLHLCYADHFLQDSFAAGHLINKTLVMQWFLQWAAGQSFLHVPNWDKIKDMTAGQQPHLAGGSAVYTQWPYTGVVKDPETGQEYTTRAQRRDASGVIAHGGQSLDDVYQNYLYMLTSSITQASTAALHDHFNEASLWVATKDRQNAFQVWGDYTLLKSGDGVAYARDTCQMSQESILNLHYTGDDGGISADDIHQRFPSRVGSSASELHDIQAWHGSLQHLATTTLFPGLITKSWALYFQQTLGHISVDDNFKVLTEQDLEAWRTARNPRGSNAGRI